MFSRTLFANALSCFNEPSASLSHGKRLRRRSNHIPPSHTQEKPRFSRKEWVSRRAEPDLRVESVSLPHRSKMEGHIPLPKGHLLNLQPRARNGRRTKFSDQGAENEQNGAHPTGTDQKSAGSKIGNPETPQTLLRRGKATKLPMPRAFADNGTEQKREASVTPQKKEQNIKVQGQMKRSPGASDRESPNSTKNASNIGGKFEGSSTGSRLQHHATKTNRRIIVKRPIERLFHWLAHPNMKSPNISKKQQVQLLVVKEFLSKGLSPEPK